MEIPLLDKALVDEALTMRLGLPEEPVWDIPLFVQDGAVFIWVTDMQTLTYIISEPAETVKKEVEAIIRQWLKGAKDAEKASPNPRCV